MTTYPEAPVPAHSLTWQPATSIFRRITAALKSSRLRDESARTYRELLCAEEHVLLDLGVTRLEVLRLLEEINVR
jgi:uncharacterized protein YjiS (DUF1127 family)